MRRPMSKERAREIADNPGTSIVSDTRRALLWALDELSARDGEIILLKARITVCAGCEDFVPCRTIRALDARS